MSEFDIDTLRAETPGCNEVIHLNNAGAALSPRAVLTASIDFLESEARLGGYEAATSRAGDVDRVYEAGAILLGCRPGELAFMPSATHAWMNAMYAVPLEAGDRVLASTSEYVSNAFGLMRLRQRGVEVELIPNDNQGQTSVEALEDMLDERVKLVCATHIPTGGGIVNPAAEIGRVTKAAGALYLLDATQSVGQMTVDVKELRCDFLTITGRKFLRGPRGTGLLYVRPTLRGLNDPVFMDGRSARWTGDWSYSPVSGARRFETFEASMAAKVGLGRAIEYALDIGLDTISRRIQELGESLRKRLASAPFVRVVEAPGPQSAIVPFFVEGRGSEAVVAALRAWGVNTSVIEPLPRGFDPDGRNTHSLIRASVHYYNTDDELDDAIATI
ncbi:MAG: aminotransferase class V-fold PLP-dependent enzyme [Actinomycetia bacterium]|nr:aminotransferase class V-fold PLP-dependent enzyme [Actinomycetes bacterium]MCP5030966.1 aminotransferase class V-fold PLP-dependent enzyme [Actinomycetes bacterium]